MRGLVDFAVCASLIGVAVTGFGLCALTVAPFGAVCCAASLFDRLARPIRWVAAS